MIFTLNILIDLLLIFAIWRNKSKVIFHKTKVVVSEDKQLRGRLDKMYISAKIAEKMAERAFNLASTANLGVVALQKSLVLPKLATKQQLQSNQLAKDNVDKLFSSGGTFDWLRPILSDEELDILDKAQETNGMEHKE